jgi:SAM-dependent methyltransferase
MRKPEGQESMSDLLPEEIDWGKAWTDAQSRSPLKASEIDRSKWPHFYDVYAGQYLKDVLSGEPHYRKIVEFLRREEIFKPGDSVLDVGSGPGTFSLLLAEQAGKVTALDYSAGMLETLAREAEARGLANIERVRSTWDDYAPEEKYNLVLASYSPAVNDERSLLRMEELSSGSCCFVTSGAPSAGGLFYDLSEAVYGQRPQRKSKLALYPFHLLFSLGRKPGVRFFDTEMTISMPAEHLIELSDIYLSIFTVMDDNKRKKIRAFALANSEGGIYKKKVGGVAAVIYWAAHGRMS